MTSDAPARRSFSMTKGVVVAIVAGLMATIYFQFSDSLTLDQMAGREASLRDYGDANPVAVYAVAFSIYVVITGLSLPGAVVLTLVTGWFFGFVGGLVLVSFASTTGATIAFLLSRYLVRDAIQARFGDRLKSFNENLRREGGFYLFTLRLIPAVPFFVINAVMGLTPMTTWTFWWVSQIGMLPGTAVFVYAGSTVPSLSALAANGVGSIFTREIAIAFTTLGLFPLVVRYLMKRYQNASDVTS